jgi:hypothetical protein
MSERKTVYLVGPRQVETAKGYVADPAHVGWRMELTPPAKKRIQEEKYHAMCGDIAAQCEFMGRKWDTEDWKRLLVDAFASAMREAGTPLHHDGRVIPSLDGQRVVQLGIQTRKFYVAEASQFIEYLFAWGAENGVEWTEPAAMETI